MDENKIINTNTNIIDNNINTNLIPIPIIQNQNIGQKQNYNSGFNRFVDEQMNKVLNKNNHLSTSVNNLTKTYFFWCCKKNVRAVNHLYLGLEPNEKFGLLGFNGSGKSTTFKAITNDIFYEEGEILLFGVNTEKNFNDIRHSIGYCPQENPLFDYLTVRETINFFKILKNSDLDAETICKNFGLSSHINKYCSVLSGGNKRKLVFALALMNAPSILLLDEPSTGVDPESRRIMWKNINELSNEGNKYNMILSTHSMEEAEVLCDTVSWLKRGNFECVGNPEKLKLMYSVGYKLQIKFNDEKTIKLNLQNNPQEIVNNFIRLNIVNLHYCNAFFNNANFIKYFYLLYSFLSVIIGKCKTISINEIGKDFSFKLSIHIKEESQSQLFSQILNMKNGNDFISEININIESLENVLTSL
jgi:ABC-type multidrug transport system ATPase subunit